MVGVDTLSWTVLIPAKPVGTAKTRLRGAVPADRHEDLVRALTLDTVHAALAAPGVAEVIVITDDRAVAVAAVAAGAASHPDQPGAGLNAALAYGATRARPAYGVAALPADLPALRPADLGAALRAASACPRAYVADAAGTGTVLLTAAPGSLLAPRFGADSARAHAGAGAVDLDPAGEAWPSLRRDVDTLADLRAAAAVGLGPHTRAVLHPDGIGCF